MKKFGLIGTPLTHSFSQGYFKNKFKEENILNSEYKNYEIDKVSYIRNLIKKEKNICGLNVTIPYKEQVIPYLDKTHRTQLLLRLGKRLLKSLIIVFNL